MKKIDSNAIMLQARRTWGKVNPVSKTFKSKRDYNRHDKSWKKDY
jgi:hypothetical protein